MRGSLTLVLNTVFCITELVINNFLLGGSTMRESAISITLLVSASIAFYIYASDYIDMVDAYNKAALAQNNMILSGRHIQPEEMHSGVATQ